MNPTEGAAMTSGARGRKTKVDADEKFEVEDKVDSDEEVYATALYPYSEKETDIDALEINVQENPFTVSDLIKIYDVRKSLKVDPDFQRNRVWNRDQQSRFVESLLLNIPLAPLYLNQDRKGAYIVVDGLQRFTAVYDYVKGTYPLENLKALPWLNGKRFNQLGSKLKARIEDKKLPCYVIKPSVEMRRIYDIFNRINTSGTQLNRQEIRNCLYLGKASQLTKELAADTNFKKAIGTSISVKRMKDREAVLRYIAFRLFNYQTDYRGDMDDFLNRASQRINETPDDEIDSIRSDFRRVMDWSFKLFKESSFRIPNSQGKGRASVAVMESTCHFLASKSDKYLKENSKKISLRFKELVKDQKYKEAVRVSTGDTERVKTRFNIAARVLGGE